MKAESLRILLVPALILVMAAAVFLFTRGPEEKKGPGPKGRDPRKVEGFLREGRDFLARAEDPANADWHLPAAEAARRFRFAIVEDPDNVEAREGAARACARAGEYGPAVDHLDFLLRRSPDRADLRELRGDLRWRLAYAMDGHIPPRPVKILTATRTPPLPLEAGEARKLVLVDGPSSSGRYPLREAEELFRAGKVDEAAAKAESADPRLLERAMLLAMIALDRGEDPGPALEPLVRRSFPPALMLRARLAIEKGDWETARRDSQRAVDIRPMTWPDAWHHLGIAHLRLGSAVDAVPALLKAGDLDPSLDDRFLREAREEAVKRFKKEE